MLLAPLLGCVSPVSPEFQFIEGIVFVDAFVTTTPGSSFVNVFESISQFEGQLENEFIQDAEVFFRNVDTGDTVILTEQEETYLPPEDFVANVGDSWELVITLLDGRRYQSTPDRIVPSVPIMDINATFNPELSFSESANRFIPGHFVFVDINDPPEEENFYFWTFRSYEKLIVCETCQDGIFRNGECVDNEPGSGRLDFYNYECDTNCWLQRKNENIRIFSDEFSNGININGIPVADVPLFTREDIVVQLEQFSLSASAYEYYNILEDIVENNGGVNAPPPAALIGNMFNPDDDTEFVLGRFTAAASSRRNIFIDRTPVQVAPLESEAVVVERCLDVCPPINCAPSFEPGCNPIVIAICEEGPLRTAFIPEGFIIQDDN